MAHFSSGSGAEVGEVVWVCTNRRKPESANVVRANVPESHLGKADIMSGVLMQELTSRDVDWVALAGFL